MAWKSHLQGCQSNTLYSISPGIENHSLFLVKSVWLAYLGVYQKLRRVSFSQGLLSIAHEIAVQNTEIWNCTPRERGNYGKHRRSSLPNALFSVLVAVVCWLKIFKYNRKRCTQRNPQHGNQTRLPFWLVVSRSCGLAGGECTFHSRGPPCVWGLGDPLLPLPLNLH